LNWSDRARQVARSYCFNIDTLYRSFLSYFRLPELKGAIVFALGVRSQSGFSPR
jgi:hypothetical protein